MRQPTPTTEGQQASGDPGSRRRRPWLPVLLVAAVVSGVVAVAFLRGGDDAASNPDSDSEVVDETPSSGGAALPEEELTVGDTAQLPDGALARLNGVEDGVTLDPGLPPPAADTRLVRLDVELCAGETELFVDAAFWLGYGDDANVHSSHMGVRDLVTLTMAPGTCQRGTVDVALPEAVALEEILLADTERTTAARWSIDLATAHMEPTAPLASDMTPATTPVGEAATPTTGGTVTLHSVDDATADAQDTRRLRIDGERCAAEQHLPVNPRHWFIQLDDHRLVAPDGDTTTMASGEIEPQGCDRGTAEFAVPADRRVTAVVYTYGAIFEEARWRVDE